MRRLRMKHSPNRMASQGWDFRHPMTIASSEGTKHAVLARAFRGCVLSEMLGEALAHWERPHRPKLPTP